MKLNEWCDNTHAHELVDASFQNIIANTRTGRSNVLLDIGAVNESKINGIRDVRRCHHKNIRMLHENQGKKGRLGTKNNE